MLESQTAQYLDQLPQGLLAANDDEEKGYEISTHREIFRLN